MIVRFNVSGTIEVPDDSKMTEEFAELNVNGVVMTVGVGFSSDHSGYFLDEELEKMGITIASYDSCELSTEK